MSDISRLSRRLIPCLDVRDGRLTKGIKFEGNIDIGDPVETARRYYEEGADEIVFYDITASHESRGIFLDVVERVASCIFIPFSVGGGISTVEQMDKIIFIDDGEILAVGTHQALYENCAAYRTMVELQKLEEER